MCALLSAKFIPITVVFIFRKPHHMFCHVRPTLDTDGRYQRQINHVTVTHLSGVCVLMNYEYNFSLYCLGLKAKR